MEKYKDIYMQKMTEVFQSVMEKCISEKRITQEDLTFISIYRGELKRNSRTPVLRQLVQVVKEVSDVLSDETDETDEEVINDGEL